MVIHIYTSISKWTRGLLFPGGKSQNNIRFPQADCGLSEYGRVSELYKYREDHVQNIEI